MRCHTVAALVVVLACGCGLPEGIWGDDGRRTGGEGEGEGEGEGDVGEGEGEGEALAACCDVDDLIVDAAADTGATYGRVSFAYGSTFGGGAKTWHVGLDVGTSEGGGVRYTTTYGALDDVARDIPLGTLFSSGIAFFDDPTAPVVTAANDGPTIITAPNAAYHSNGDGFAGPETVTTSVNTAVFGDSVEAPDGSALVGYTSASESTSGVVGVVRRAGGFVELPAMPLTSFHPPFVAQDLDGVVHAVVVGDNGVSYLRLVAGAWESETIPGAAVDNFGNFRDALAKNASFAIVQSAERALPVFAMLDAASAVHLYARDGDGTWSDRVVATSDATALLSAPRVAVDDGGRVSLALIRSPTAGGAASPSLRLFRDKGNALDGEDGFDQTIIVEREYFAGDVAFVVDGGRFRFAERDTSRLRFLDATTR